MLRSLLESALMSEVVTHRLRHKQMDKCEKAGVLMLVINDTENDK